MIYLPNLSMTCNKKLLFGGNLNNDKINQTNNGHKSCLLYTSDAADD